MHHSYLDKYARGDSPLHRIDSRVKLLLIVTSVIVIASIPNPGTIFIASWIILVVLLSISGRIPLTYLLTRSAVVIPFSGFAAFSYALTSSSGELYWQLGPFTLTSDGLIRSIVLLLRAWIAVSLMIILVNTTPFDRVLKSLRSFKIPSLFVLLLSFLYRYLYLLWDEAERMQRARNLRYFGGQQRRQFALLGHLVTALFLRSYERAERVQQAMVARGWNGEVHFHVARPLAVRDLTILIIGFTFLVLLWSIRIL